MNVAPRGLARIAVAAVAFTSTATSRADTIVTDRLVGGQVWTSSKGPYRISANAAPVRVPRGQTLRIEAGTTVSFPILKDGLTVEGTLTIDGTDAAPVILQGDGTFEAGYPVAGIGFPAGSEGGRITGAIVRNAITGVLIQAPNVMIARTMIENCERGLRTNVRSGPASFAFDALIVRNNHVGMEVQGDATQSLTLTNSLIHHNGLDGVQGWGPVIAIVNSTFDRNAYGVYAFSNPAGLTVRNSIFTANGIAVKVDDANGPASLQTAVTFTTFWSNDRHTQATYLSGGTRIDDIVKGTDVPAGAGNMVSDPAYLVATPIDPDSQPRADLHLMAQSTCIDSGDGALAPDHDLEGRPRPLGKGVDRGAYETPLPHGGSGGASGSVGGSGAAGRAGVGSEGGSSGTAGGAVAGGAAGASAMGGANAGGSSGHDASSGGATSAGGGAGGSGGEAGAAAGSLGGAVDGRDGPGGGSGGGGGAGHDATGGRSNMAEDGGSRDGKASPGTGSGCSCAVRGDSPELPGGAFWGAATFAVLAFTRARRRRSTWCRR